MPAVWTDFAVALRSDGRIFLWGRFPNLRPSILRLKAGVTFCQVAAGDEHFVLLRSDGLAVADGSNTLGECDIPPAEAGITYTQVAAGGSQTLLLRSDGRVVVCGGRVDPLTDVAEPGMTHTQYGDGDVLYTMHVVEAGMKYTQIATGGAHRVLLRCDGHAIACGENGAGQCDIPPLEDGVSYAQVALGLAHTVLLRSDGSVVACGENSSGQSNLPLLPRGMIYTQVAAGKEHTLLMRSDGQAVVCGKTCCLLRNETGTYSCVAAGGNQTLLLRSDGRVVDHDPMRRGAPVYMQLPELVAGLSYVPADGARDFVVQLLPEERSNGRSVECRNLMTGELLASWVITTADLSRCIIERVWAEVPCSGQRLRIVMPDGGALRGEQTWSEFLEG